MHSLFLLSFHIIPYLILSYSVYSRKIILTFYIRFKQYVHQYICLYKYVYNSLYIMTFIC